jgi:DNA processing protein
MGHPLTKMRAREVSTLLAEIPQPPETVWVRGALPPPDAACLAVVGSRNYTDYGKQAVEYLIGGLRGHRVSIISGLALGIDACAHTAALAAGLHTLAVPGSGIDDSVIYPRRNRPLAERILREGGGLLSEYEPTFEAAPWSFPQRNRIMAGLAHAVLLIEAGERSGTLITARLAVEYNRDLLAVPGSIFSENSRGTHQFLKLGAVPVTSPRDILEALHMDTNEGEAHSADRSLSPAEDAVLAALGEPRDHDALVRLLALPAEEALVLIMQMELKGLLKEENGVFFRADR